MPRRVFVAIDLPEKAKAEISGAITEWRWLPIRWLDPANWHVTLIPPVYLLDDEIEFFGKYLARYRLGGPFRMQFERMVLAPPGVSARMIWLEGRTPPELVRLQEKITVLWAKKPADLPPLRETPRRATLHTTLARFEPGDLREIQTKTRVLGETKVLCTANEIAIMESHLKSSGAEYETITAIAL